MQMKTYHCIRVDYDFWQIIITNGTEEKVLGVFDENLTGATMCLDFLGYKEV